MAQPIYVLGHRNPDTDSICSALGYAELMRLQGRTTAVAGRLGPLRRETEYILQRFGVEPPLLVTDVRPRVVDVMTRPPVTVPLNATLYDVGQILQEQDIRVVVVVDDRTRLCGVTGQADFAVAFVRVDEFDSWPLDLGSLLRTLDGQLLVDAPGSPLVDRLMVGAMEIDSMRKRLEPGIVLVIGDRADAQRAAIEAGVGALIVTGDHPVIPENLALARERGVRIIKVPHHTYTTLRLIQLSIPVRYVMRRDVATCQPDDLVAEALERLRNGPTRSLIVVDEQNKVQGIISRSNLLRPVRRQVVLVDHNERGQAVAGIEDADVIAVIDHHRVADLWTRNPPYMRLEPVGATSTIVAKLYDEAAIPMSDAIAGVLLSGILADTLLFLGPTTTAEDRRVAERLASRIGIDPEALGTAILDIASDVSDRSAKELLTADFKEFTVEGVRFGIGTIETTNGEAVLKRKSEMLQAMAGLRGQGFASVIFAVIDIVHARTTLLVTGLETEVAAAFDVNLVDDHVIEIPGILSRKKNIVPQLGTIADAATARA